MEYVRNFTIIAHIDHGKSTLADRLIQMCGSKVNQERVLDSMDLEREKGITIKSQTARLKYIYNKQEYILNLIDTPGHVDFSYEVQRSLYACEVSILLVDATSGIQAQTLKNAMLALAANHSIITVLNKIDMDNADPVSVKEQVESLIGIDQYCEVSAKTGQGVERILELLVTSGQKPKGNINDPFRAFVLDSWYDKYLGVIILMRVVDGLLESKQEVKLLNSDFTASLPDIGYLTPIKLTSENIKAGDIAYAVTRRRNAKAVHIGDTIVISDDSISQPIFDDFVKVKQSVFCIITPVDNTTFEDLYQAVERLSLNDSSFVFIKYSSAVLGIGLRCGFLGLLHMEVTTERLRREFNLDIIITTPSVSYELLMSDDKKVEISDPSIWPETQFIKAVYEPFVETTVLSPSEYIGGIIELCKSKRGIQKDIRYTSVNMVVIVFDMPLSAIIVDFHDRLQSVTQGYASFDYDNTRYIQSQMTKIDIKVNHEIVDAFSVIIHVDELHSVGSDMCERLAKLITRQQFNIPIQAVINGSKVIARSNVRPYRKDVTAKCYGGDVTRKMKLLRKQKRGKDKMIKAGKVEIPNSAVLEFIKGSNS